jgi:hypothetical protein
MKYLGVNLTKAMNDLYKENYKPLKKKIKEDYRRLRDLPCKKPETRSMFITLY